MSRFEELLQSMDPTMPAPCHHITAAGAVVLEYPPSPERDEAVATIAQMAAAQREVCRCFNNLRSLTATIESQNGNESPVFYVGNRLKPGDKPTPGCNCGTL